MPTSVSHTSYVDLPSNCSYCIFKQTLLVLYAALTINILASTSKSSTSATFVAASCWPLSNSIPLLRYWIDCGILSTPFIVITNAFTRKRATYREQPISQSDRASTHPRESYLEIHDRVLPFQCNVWLESFDDGGNTREVRESVATTRKSDLFHVSKRVFRVVSFCARAYHVHLIQVSEVSFLYFLLELRVSLHDMTRRTTHSVHVSERYK